VKQLYQLESCYFFVAHPYLAMAALYLTGILAVPRLRSASATFVALPALFARCVLNLSSLSSVTPRSLTLFVGRISFSLNHSAVVLSLAAPLHLVRWIKDAFFASNTAPLVRSHFSNSGTTSFWILRVLPSADGPITHAE
jgi:hypothetical protein